MPNRNMSAAMLAEISQSKVHMVSLLKLNVSTPVFMTNAHKNIVFNGDTYQRSGSLLKIGAIKETLAIRVGYLNIQLSGVDQSFISIFLSENITNKEVTVYQGFLTSDGVLIADPVETFSGLIDYFSVTEDTAKGSAIVKLKAASDWADFERVAGRRTNSADQQAYYPNDLGFDNAAAIIKDIRWGSPDA